MPLCHHECQYRGALAKNLSLITGNLFQTKIGVWSFQLTFLGKTAPQFYFEKDCLLLSLDSWQVLHDIDSAQN